MGGLISRFRKKPTTLEQLKKIEENLKEIDEYKRITERKQKRTVANVIIYGAALYILAVVIVFVWFLPENWAVRLGLMIPMILVPAIIYWTKRLISRYFQNRMVRANEDYADLQRKKQGIIDNVMETETYNKAKEILSKYAPDKLEKKLQERGALVGAESGELRKRTTGTFMTPPIGKPVPPPRPTDNGHGKMQAFSANAPPVTGKQLNDYGPPAQMPQTLFPKERSFSDKLVEYIVGDGPGYRYALICQACHGHNGMALKEEFPYIGYKCCYCRHFNAARKERPQAPKLPDPSNPPPSPKARVPVMQLEGPNVKSKARPISMIRGGSDGERYENEIEDEIDPVEHGKDTTEQENSKDEQEVQNEDKEESDPNNIKECEELKKDEVNSTKNKSTELGDLDENNENLDTSNN